MFEISHLDSHPGESALTPKDDKAREWLDKHVDNYDDETATGYFRSDDGTAFMPYHRALDLLYQWMNEQHRLSVGLSEETEEQPLPASQHVPVSKFGKDHWSLLLYIEVRCVDHRGILDKSHMRTDAEKHPLLVGNAQALSALPLKKYPTILADKEELADHDDWDCAEDLEAAGFVENTGTGITPSFRVTDKGMEVVHLLRKRKAKGYPVGSFLYE